MISKNHLLYKGKPKLSINILFFVYAMFFSQAILAVQASSSEVYKIQGIAGEYLGFSMADVNAESCRQGAPDWPKVTGLPTGMYSSGCSIYGYPENTGTTRIEFPVESGVWLADIVAVDENAEPTPEPDDIYQIQGIVNKYLGFDMSDVNTESCRQGLPDWPKVEGLPAGMYSSGCNIYGYPENTGTMRIEFPVESGVWLADIVVDDNNAEPPPEPDNIYKIQGVVDEYLGFDMSDVNAETCRQGAPDWPKVAGLPTGMHSSGCSLYGYPENTGTTRIEFPVESGVWLADIVVASNNSDPSPEPEPEPDPNPDTPPTPIPANPASSAAARFLAQASFGANTDAINHLLGLENYESWIDEQFNMPPSLLLPGTHAIYQAFYEHCISNSSSCPASLDEIKTLGSLNNVDTEIKQSRFVWWANAIDGADQLRQRVAFALSEILVVSDIPIPLRRSQFGVASYYDMLIQHSFGNYRNLLEAVSLHPVMGMYLSHVQNEKANPERNIRPDENYARELLQLFSIGVHQLNLDGTLVEDAEGKPKATYGQAEIQEFAKVFTGWNFAGLSWGGYYGRADKTMPMEPNEAYHDDTEKSLFDDLILPAGQTARQDLDAALNNIFEHPNVGPFISKQLIQRLVTSNPTPAYVSRVASIFNNNGAGVRGDMKAVIKAILLDTEARNGQSTVTDFGKMREPVLRISHVWRAFNATKTDNSYFDWQVPPGVAVYSTLGLQEIVQEVLRSSSVFNFFQPGHSPAGPVRDAGLVAPEFQIATENVVMGTTNIINSHIQTPQPSDPRYTYLNLDNETAIAVDLNTLLDHLNILLLSGSMSDALHAIIYTHLSNANFPDGIEGTDARVRDAITLIVNSPEYLIQK